MSDFADYGGFCPLDYLRAYYSELQTESEGLLRFLVSVLETAPYAPLVLDFGGPALFGLIPAARFARAIHFCDYIPENRKYVSRWLGGDDSEFDWSPYIARCLELEGARTDGKAIANRAACVRNLVTRTVHCDIFEPLQIRTRFQYEVIVSNYCMGGVTNSKADWQSFVIKLTEHLKPGGTLILFSSMQPNFYEFGTARSASAWLGVDDLSEALVKTGFDPASIRVESAATGLGCKEYGGVVFACASLPQDYCAQPWRIGYESGGKNQVSYR